MIKFHDEWTNLLYVYSNNDKKNENTARQNAYRSFMY